MSATDINQYNASYCPNQKYYKQNVTNYMKNPKNQVQDFVCDDNASEDSPPIISPKEFVTNNINLSNQTDQLATRVFKPEFKTKSNSGYRSLSTLPKYNSFRRNTTFQDFPKEYTYPISIGRGKNLLDFEIYQLREMFNKYLACKIFLCLVSYKHFKIKCFRKIYSTYTLFFYLIFVFKLYY